MKTRTSYNLPPAGPAWGGSLMGTSLVATLLVISGLDPLAWVVACIGVAILVALVVGFIIYRTPRFRQDTMAPWAMTFIGIMSLGTAWTNLTDNLTFILVGFWIGAPACLAVYANQLRGFQGQPNFAWGLALVGPIMASNTAATTHVKGGGDLYWVLGVCCMVASISAAYPLFARVYVAAWRRKVDLSGPNAATAWIPLGVVGQTVSAVDLLFGKDAELIVGTVLLIAAIPMIAFAMWHFYPAVAHWARYSPAWWASTFPTGTISVGSHHLAEVWNLEWLTIIATALPALLVLHWLLCVTRCTFWVVRER
ncbi:hypothetical protein [Corynebacterium sp. NML140438]|uniref:SLAC1 family transporter n=1 Tax=Corynebacterium sp. NML140438 TaxID=1906334 RepID=UPI0008FB9C7F|nr:hypothetical protein [Corynebacterium sp. NML140438]